MEKPCRCVTLTKGTYMQGFLLLLPAMLCTFAACTPSGETYGTPPQDTAQAAKPAPQQVGQIALPEGYRRLPAASGTYSAFLRSIPLREDNTVYLYNGMPKRNQQAQYAVLNIDVGDKDLQQCADAVMRLRAEYLYARKQYSGIAFRFTNGFRCDYEHYADGYGVQVNGNTCRWVKQREPDYSRKAFRQYLDLVYSYAGTRSLYGQLRPVAFSAISPGMVLIRTGNPYGHAVTVMDMAFNPETKDTIFLLSQSYMPAQDIHILQNPVNSRLSPWYSVHFEGDLLTPEWTFSKADLRSF